MEKKKNISTSKILLFGFAIFIITILISIYNGNHKLQTTNLHFKNANIDDNIKIIHISDLHLKYFGDHNNTLIKKITKEKPNLIFVTGDMPSFSDKNMKTITEDSMQVYNNNYEYTISTLSQFKDIAPTYFVLGNHEHVFEKFDNSLSKLKKELSNIGVTLLINEICTIKVGNSIINIFGVDNSYYQDTKIYRIIQNFEKLHGLKIILDHYPTDFYLNGKFSYVNFDIDYVFSGHEHGGQIRIPFIGGVFSHEEHLFPKYSEGVHTQNGVTLIISRGLGNSTLPIRIFNPPELIITKINHF